MRFKPAKSTTKRAYDMSGRERSKAHFYSSVTVEETLAKEVQRRAVTVSPRKLPREIASEALRAGLEATRTASTAPVVAPVDLQGLGDGNAEGTGGVQ